MKPRSVLIIDDHRDSAVMLAAVLRLRRPELLVHVAYDGEAGLSTAVAERHDIVIVDLGLPGMDGEQVAAQIRRHWGTAAPLLIAVSGSIADVARHAQGGVFDHAFTKPVSVDRLLDVLVRQDEAQAP